MPLRTLPIAAELLGLVAAGQPDPVVDWVERDGRRQPGDQARDESTGDLVWTCYLMASTAERPEVLQVRVPAAQQPVLTQFGAVAVDNLEASVRVDKAGRLAQYWAATGIRDAAQPGRKNGQGEHKPQSEHQPAA